METIIWEKWVSGGTHFLFYNGENGKSGIVFL